MSCNTQNTQSNRIQTMHQTMVRLYLAAKEMAETEGKSALGRLLNESPQTINNWESRGVSKAGMVKAQSIVGCSASWIETGSGPMSANLGIDTKTVANTSQSTSTVHLSSDTNSRRAPVLSWSRLGSSLIMDEQVHDADAFLPVPDNAPPSTNWYVVEQDMPRFRMKRGNKAAISRLADDKTCVDGEIYLFKSAGGSFFLGEFRRLVSGYEAVPDSGMPMDSDRHGVRVFGELWGTWK